MDSPEPEAALTASSARPWRLSLRRVSLHVLIAVAVQAAVLAFLASRSWLDPILPWDDVAFVERAVFHLHALRSPGPASAWLHAPLGDLQTLLGLSLFHLDVRGPYFLNFVYVAAGTLFTSYFFRGRALRTRVFATALLLTFAPLLLGAAQLKSDQKGGLFLFIATLLLFEPGRRRLGGPMRTGVIAAAFIVVLAAKMTAIYLPLVIFGIIGLRVILERRERRGEPAPKGLSRDGLSGYVLLAAAVAAGYAALFIPLRHHLLGYIEFALSAKWNAEDANWKEQVLFFTPFGGTGRYWLGHCVVTAILAVLAWKKGLWAAGERARLACIAVVACVLYLPLFLDRNLNPEFGSFVYFTVLAGTFLLIRALFHRASPGPPWAIALGTPALLLLATDSPLFHMIGDRTAPRAKMSIQQLSDSIHEGGRGNHVTFVFDTLFLPHPNLTYVHYRRHGRFLRVNRVDTFAELAGTLRTADFIVAIDDKSGGDDLIQMSAWTNNRRIPEVLDLLDAAPGWERRVTVPFRESQVRLYARRSSSAQRPATQLPSDTGKTNATKF